MIKVTWIANEKQFNLVLPLALKAIKRGIDFEILAVERIANGFGEDFSSLEIHDYLAQHGLKSIIFSHGSDALKHIQARRPDFIFTSTPYDMYFSPELSSVELSKYGTVCNVAYGASVTINADKWDEKNPYLASGPGMQFVTHRSPSATDWAVSVGNVKLEGMSLSPSSRGKTDEFLHNPKRIIGWRPRWTLNDEESFEATLKILSSFSKKHNCEVCIFVHPLMAAELTKIEKQKFATLRSMLSEDGGSKASVAVKLANVDDYLGALKDCSALVSDASTLMNEAYSLGVPVVYSGNIGDLNSRGRQIVKSGGSAQTPEDLQFALQRIFTEKCGSRKRLAFKLGFAPTDKIFLLLCLHKQLVRFGISKPTPIIKRFLRI